MEQLGRKLASGRDADIFEYGPDLVLRRSRNGRSVAREARVMAYLATQGYPVPAVHHVSDDETDLVMERINGPTMVDYLSKRPWAIRRQGRVLGELHRRLHAIPPPDFLGPAAFGEGEVVRAHGPPSPERPDRSRRARRHRLDQCRTGGIRWSMWRWPSCSSPRLQSPGEGSNGPCSAGAARSCSKDSSAAWTSRAQIRDPGGGRMEGVRCEPVPRGDRGHVEGGPGSRPRADQVMRDVRQGVSVGTPRPGVGPTPGAVTCRVRRPSDRGGPIHGATGAVTGGTPHRNHTTIDGGTHHHDVAHPGAERPSSPSSCPVSCSPPAARHRPVAPRPPPPGPVRPRRR